MKPLNIMEKKRIWFGISAAFIVAGLIALAVHGFNWGIDFTGGNILNFDIKQTYVLQDVREILTTLGITSEAKKAGDSGEQLIVRTGAITPEQQSEITSALSEKWQNLELVGSEKIDPVIGGELQKQAITALIIANLGMLVYITFRFEFKSALAAVLALIHDVAVVLSFYAIFNIPVDGTIIAVILTVVGYSINDTIVIFDRIRENLKSSPRKSFNELADLSILQSFTRTINTSVTTFLTIFALFLLGGETLKDFTLALIVGIIAGTYSSVFIASPLWGMFRASAKV